MLKKRRNVLGVVLLLMLSLLLTACGGAESENKNSGGSSGSAGAKQLNAGVSFYIASMDAHQDYNGWYTNVYGVTQELFRLNGDHEVEPWLAEDAKVSEDGRTWTVTVKENAAFSNGTAVTADMVVRNLQRAAEVNARFAYLAEFEMSALDDRTFTITTPEAYPTMKNDLASPELAIMDLDESEDLDNAPVCTGPFVVKSFTSKGDVEVVRNENYWNGAVQLDSAKFYYMPEDDTKQMALQNGEIDCYDFATAAGKALFEADPESYTVTTLPASRLQFYILNEATMDDAVREAVVKIVDKEAIVSYLDGTVSVTDGPFAESSAYGKATAPTPDVEGAQQALEADGYRKNADGYYEKDGEELDLNIAYYAARSLDTLAILMQEQLDAAGIRSHLTCEEDPDATYIANQDFDLALYCMIADKAGDPYYFIDSTLRDGSYFDVGGFDSAECEALIDELQYEGDADRRAELANEIIQMAIDDNAFSYVGLFNKITITKANMSGFAEHLPYDFYGIDENTTITTEE